MTANMIFFLWTGQKQPCFSFFVFFFLFINSERVFLAAEEIKQSIYDTFKFFWTFGDSKKILLARVA